MTRTIHLTLAPRNDLRYGYEDGAIERASYTYQDDGPEGSVAGTSPTRVAWRVLGDGHEWARWRVSCRTPDALIPTTIPGVIIGDGSDEDMISWLNADPALRGK